MTETVLDTFKDVKYKPGLQIWTINVRGTLFFLIRWLFCDIDQHLLRLFVWLSNWLINNDLTLSYPLCCSCMCLVFFPRIWKWFLCQNKLSGISLKETATWFSMCVCLDVSYFAFSVEFLRSNIGTEALDRSQMCDEMSKWLCWLWNLSLNIPIRRFPPTHTHICV